ncbi:Sec-independent protein translocase subunit TatA/TatB [Limnochorda pilosa]|uniref:Sec-independent protein translocase protein TatA n=1 Tax=Limnochorda pilosa TaxID=1555112 RepID=A0A0K2SPD8_LIMPI|nr:twin-arginine translocase TatA/TatE family subunit [Limnochorda pilosa]BAS28990.1 preprotein translocase subunit TatA [Limnochorda pilosa]
MFNLGPMELVVILILALIVFGPGKLPEVGKALGKGLNEFRRASSQLGSVSDEPPRRPSDRSPAAAAEEAKGDRPAAVPPDAPETPPSGGNGGQEKDRTA